jgi:hypothetical protein
MAREVSVRFHRHWVSVCIIHSHFIISDLFCSSMLIMARPPLFFGNVNCGQATRQCLPEYVSLLPR